MIAILQYKLTKNSLHGPWHNTQDTVSTTKLDNHNAVSDLLFRNFIATARIMHENLYTRT